MAIKKRKRAQPATKKHVSEATLAERSEGKKPPRARDREGTEQALRDAVGKLLGERGVSALSASQIAAEVGVDKALIYRYFGSFEQLIKSYAESHSYWPTVDEIVPDRGALLALPFAERFSLILRRYMRALRGRPATIAVLAAELTDRVALPPELLGRREEFGLALMQLAGNPPAGFDVAATATLLTGSIHYLLVRSTQIQLFNGIGLHTDEGWDRLEKALDAMVSGALR